MSIPLDFSGLITINSARLIILNRQKKPSSYNYVSQLIAFGSVRVVIIDGVRFVDKEDCIDFQKKKEQKFKDKQLMGDSSIVEK